MNRNSKNQKGLLAFIKRYRSIVSQCHIIFSIINEDLLENNVACSFDLQRLFMPKVAGYNCKLESVHKLIEKYQFPMKFIDYIPYAKKFIIRKILMNTSKVEFVRPQLKNKLVMSDEKYDRVYFASMDNYLSAFPKKISEDLLQGEKVLLIIPKEARDWLNYSTLSGIEGLVIVWFGQLFEYDYPEKEKEIQKIIKDTLKKRTEECEDLFKYNSINFGKWYIKVIAEFVLKYVPFSLLFHINLQQYLEKVCTKSTEFYVARQRRSSEISFVNVGNAISGKTYIINHGMLSFDIESRYFGEGYFDNVKRVYVWGEHDKIAIEERCKRLSLKIPEIECNGDYLFNANPKPKLNNNRKSKRILFIAQDTHDCIQYLVKNIPKKYDLVIRLHPGQKYKIPLYKKKYINNKNVIVDELLDPIETVFNSVDLCLSYSSTAVLKSIHANIPTLLLAYNKLIKSSVDIFSENDLDINEFRLIRVSDSDNIGNKIEECLKNTERTKSINKRLFKQFVRLRKK
jgi:hypothetical protein